MKAEIRSTQLYDNPKDLKQFLSCTDHTVSRETFTLLLDTKTEMLITSPRPSEEALPAYYESDAYISHTDSTKSLMDKAYQIIKSYSLKKKLRLMNKLSPAKGRLLDIGCGTGDFIKVCQDGGYQVTGVEPNDKARSLARQKVASDVTLETSVDNLPFNDQEKFDIITMWHVLEHVPNLEAYIAKLEALLSPNGCLIIAVPNYKSYDASYYKEYWAAYDVPRHLWHFSKNSMKVIFRPYGFQVVKTLPLIFDSFYVSLLSEKYKSGRSNLFSGIKTGLMSNLKARRTGEYSSLIYILKKD